MDKATHERWWPLHIRNATGETLTPEEQASYDEGRNQLYASENLDGNVEDIKQLRTHILEMETQLAEMMEQYRALKAKAEYLEGKLSEPVKHYIGVGG